MPGALRPEAEAAVFQPNFKDRENTPILAPLALDDVTVVYGPPGGRRIVTWEPWG